MASSKSVSHGSYVTLSINRNRMKSLIDTGSHFSLMSSSTANRLRIRTEPMNAQNCQSLFSANGEALKLVAIANVLLDFSKLRIPHTIYICQNLHENLLLGRQFLTESQAILNFRNQTITFSDMLEMPLTHAIDKHCFVRSKEQLCVPPNSEIIFAVSCNAKFESKEVLLSPISGEQFRRFAVANSLSQVENNQTFCRLMNFSEKCLIINQGQKVAQISNFNDQQQCMLVSQGEQEPDRIEKKTTRLDERTLENFAQEYGFKINKEISEELRLDLLQILHNRKEAFARSVSDLSTYNKQEFEFEMTSTKPCWQRQFKHKPETARIIQHHVNAWKAQGIVEPSQSFLFNSCIFLVPKGQLQGNTKGKPNSEANVDRTSPANWRPVVDLRAINKRVQRYVIYTPSTHELIEEITKYSDEAPHQRSTYYSSFDLFHGYLQLAIKKDGEKGRLSRESTSFTSPEGERLCFTRLLFGHHLSSALFSSVMNRVFGPMKAKGNLCYYIDDSIIHTVTPELHLKKIDEYLSLLIENNLRCSVSKTFFMFTSIKWLGVIIDKDGIKIPPEITRTLDKLESAKITTPKQVMSLLGYFQFWQNFLPRLAQRTHHLRQLTKKNVIFRFTPECQAERVDIIKSLRANCTLQGISPGEDLYCFVDSSSHGIGVTWAQAAKPSDDPKTVDKELNEIRKGRPTLKPILHQSWTIGKSQLNYGSTYHELFGA